MSKNAHRSQTSGVPQPKASGLARETRVDPAHPVADGRDAAPRAIPNAGPLARDANQEVSTPVALVLDDVPEEVAALAVVQQVRLQAQQLATALRKERAEVDRREAQVYARLAQQENGDRSLRLWLREGHESLAQREADVARREQHLERRLRGVSTDEPRESDQWDSAVENTDMSLSDSLTLGGAIVELARRFLRGESTLATSKSKRRGNSPAPEGDEGSITALLADLPRSQLQLVETIAEALERIRQREAALGQAERLVAGERKSFESVQRQFAADRQALVAEVESARRQRDERIAQQDAQRARQVALLEERAQRLEARAKTLEELRERLHVSQREVLENTLAAEELWAECGGPQSAAAREAVNRTRRKLADVHRDQRDEVAAREEALAALARQMAEQQRQLIEQRDEVSRTARELQTQFEKQKTHLDEREQQLRQAGAELDQARRQWQSERQEADQACRLLVEEARNLTRH